MDTSLGLSIFLVERMKKKGEEEKEKGRKNKKGR
jgi:hypothetical protein